MEIIYTLINDPMGYSQLSYDNYMERHGKIVPLNGETKRDFS